jgi:hypothetical protein
MLFSAPQPNLLKPIHYLNCLLPKPKAEAERIDSPELVKIEYSKQQPLSF